MFDRLRFSALLASSFAGYRNYEGYRCFVDAVIQCALQAGKRKMLLSLQDAASMPSSTGGGVIGCNSSAELIRLYVFLPSSSVGYMFPRMTAVY